MKTVTHIVLTTLAAVTTLGALHAWQEGGGWQPSRPGPAHAVLADLEGQFDAKFTLLAPGAPKMESQGTSKNDRALGGLWVRCDYHDPSYMGTEFRGMSLIGYDADKKKYVGVWVDSSTSALQISEGTWDEKTKTLTMLSEGKDPYSKQPTQDKTITKIVDKDHHVVTLRSKSAGHPEADIFRIEYTRK
ncbi:MAG: DUF1579 domain-containing protein [Planctomycetes bacterium]|nr:DUF1579 domain-containing protein [Planctomycetota bacterium]